MAGDPVGSAGAGRLWARVRSARSWPARGAQARRRASRTGGLTRYLSYQDACAVVDGARIAAQETGDWRIAPPYLLEECNKHIAEGALGAPGHGFGEHEFYPGLAAKAAVLAYGFAKGHACGDGNKRLALILSSAFLELNGYDIEAEADETEHIFRTVAESEPADREVMLDNLCHWFQQVIRPLDEGGGQVPWIWTG